MLVTEISYPSYRAPLTSAYNSLWYSGAIVYVQLSSPTDIVLINPSSAAWTTYGTFKIPSTWSWRIPSALQALPSVAQVCLVLFAPESPRWLLSKGKDDRALKTLAYYHADGNVYVSNVLPHQQAN